MRDELKRLKKAVREKCLDCSGGTAAEVALCELEECPLFPFRMELWPSLFGEAAEQLAAAGPPPENPAGENGGPQNSGGQFSLL